MNLTIFFQTLAIVIIVQSFLYVLFLLKDRSLLSNRLLATFLLVVIATFLNLFLRNNYNITYFFYELASLMTPLIYLYVSSLTIRSFKLTSKNVIHFSGFFIIAIIHLTEVSWDGLHGKIIPILLFIYSYVYLFLSVKRIRLFHKSLMDQSSNYNAHNLKWLNFEILVLSICFISLGIESVALITNYKGAYEMMVLCIFLSFLIFINILTYKSLTSPHQFELIEHNPENKYVANKLSLKDSKNYYNILLDLISKEKPFKNGDLHLKELARMMDISPAILSQVINQNSKMNFNDFINKFRVDEAKKLLQNRELLIKQVMYECGFNSTSTFNEVFKKHVNMNPSKYRSEL